jgi:Cu(I)/Ag(I) efflux system membrane fusion protein
MDPKFRSDKPGKSPMGMDLVPVYVDHNNDNVVKISPAVINNLGVVTYKTKFQKLSRVINTVGYVTANENLIENVHSYIDGWVRNLKVNAVGYQVKKGQVLFELFSPSLVNAQQELLLAIKSNNKSLITAGRKKLKTLGLDESQINHIISKNKAQKQIAILAKTSGIVAKLNIRDGMYIKPSNMLMVIEDLSSIWIQVKVYEKESNWVELGQSAITEFAGLPGRQWQGEVVYVYPRLDIVTHTLPVRLKFPNPDLTLKPNMYSFVQIFVPNDKKYLTIPLSAIIQTGKGEHVILALGNGRFKAQNVTLGYSLNNMVAITNGLQDGDVVVTSGQFLIDSESDLNAAFERLEPTRTDTFANQSMTNLTKNKMEQAFYNGKILSINIKKKMLTLSHKPIKKFAMPTMVMEVKVANNIDLKKYKVNQMIKFRLKNLKNNKYELIEINNIKQD